MRMHIADIVLVFEPPVGKQSLAVMRTVSAVVLDIGSAVTILG